MSVCEHARHALALHPLRRHWFVVVKFSLLCADEEVVVL